MPDIFISHSKDDAKSAKEVARRCKTRGLSVFVDQDSIKPGEDWLERINEEIEDCEALWLLATKSAMASRMVNQELGAARAHNVEIIPIIWDMSPEELPNELQRLQAVVLTNKSRDEVDKQIGDLILSAARGKKYRLMSNIAIVGLVLAAVFFGSKSGGEG